MIQDMIIPDMKMLEKAKQTISAQGKKRFHVIADFDRTLTKAFVDGQKCPTVIGQLRNGNYLASDYSSRAHALFDKYYPIETDPKLGREEKIPKMHEWWERQFKLLVECGLDKDVMKDIVSRKTLKFRDGALEFIDLLHRKSIPLVIMSAGPGDMIREYLMQEGRLYNNVHVIANIFEFDRTGKVTGIREPIIHSMNKHETVVLNYPVFDIIKDRKNVLLLGDGPDDVGMVDGFDYDNMIKAGFLNENADENIEQYKKNFDIVLLNDSDMGCVNSLLSEMF
ncbi:MAG: haloacid dehalogenase-like hydrolase [archaeon]|nr:haloacid dehalogenase-like hydrolase [archaeon]